MVSLSNIRLFFPILNMFLHVAIFINYLRSSGYLASDSMSIPAVSYRTLMSHTASSLPPHEDSFASVKAFF